MPDKNKGLTTTEVYKLLQVVADGADVYTACRWLELDRNDMEHSLNDVELRVLIIDIAVLANVVRKTGG